MSMIVPCLVALLLAFALFKKVDVYGSFVGGAKNAVGTAVGVLPYLSAMFLMVNLLRASGIGGYVVDFLAFPLSFLGIPKQLVELMLLRPFSGSGSLAILKDVYLQHGVDTYVGRCASVIMGSSETVFYVSAVYFAGTKIKHTGWAIPIALFCNLVGGVLACILCRFV